MINIDELKKYNEQRKKLKYEPYKLILEMVCNKVKEASLLLGLNYCIYQVPEFMLGYTTYDVKDCIQWLKKKLIKMDMSDVDILENNILLIIWKH